MTAALQKTGRMNGNMTKPDRGWKSVIKQIQKWARLNSIWAVHFNSGSCNGCDIEILATLTPRYDVERFGIKLEGSPRHADVMIVTGPVTRQTRERLLRVYQQMPAPRFVVAVGACALSAGTFAGCYNVLGGIDCVIPVDVYIPGCPPRPEAIVDGIIQLLTALQNGAYVPPNLRPNERRAESALSTREWAA
jgi:NADH-quinone oxidoreductase B subunit